MTYSKKESYTFKCPEEFKAYLEFKHQLNDSGVRFTESGGSSFQSIEIHTHGIFDVNEEGVQCLRSQN